VRENVRMREQELNKCQEIVAERAAALLARLNPAPARQPAVSAQPAFTIFQPAVCSS
jgi:hypothetical protein